MMVALQHPMRSVLLTVLLTAAAAAFGTASSQLHAEVLDQHPRIYVAPLPPIFNYRVLTDYDVKRFFHQFGTDPQALISQPVGAIENHIAGMELRNTYMYGLDIIFHTQLLHSPLRVHSQEEADVIYLPFYAALECRLSQAMEGDAHKAAYTKRVEKFWEDFETNFPFYRNKPHVMVVGRREAELMGSCGVGDGMYGKVKACTLLCNKLADYIHVITVEVWTGSLETMQPKRHRTHSIPVPWPGHFHISAGSLYHHRQLAVKELVAAKPTLAMESLRVRFPLRKTLSEQCAAKGAPWCFHYSPRGNIGQMNQTAIYEATHSAWFCLQPYGDGPSRHVTMDCIAADTIPVFFDRYLRQHSAFADVVDYSEFTAVVNPRSINTTNIIDLLEKRYPLKKRIAMALRLHQVKHIFLYSVNPLHTLVRFDEMKSVHPHDDAFTSSLKALLRHACAKGTLPVGRCSGATGPPSGPAVGAKSSGGSGSSMSSRGGGIGVGMSSGADTVSSGIAASGPQWAKGSRTGWKAPKKVTIDPVEDSTAGGKIHVAAADVAVAGIAAGGAASGSKGTGASDAKRRVAPGYDPKTWKGPDGTGKAGDWSDSFGTAPAASVTLPKLSDSSSSTAGKREWDSKAGRWVHAD